MNYIDGEHMKNIDIKKSAIIAGNLQLNPEEIEIYKIKYSNLIEEEFANIGIDSAKYAMKDLIFIDTDDAFFFNINGRKPIYANNVFDALRKGLRKYNGKVYLFDFTNYWILEINLDIKNKTELKSYLNKLFNKYYSRGNPKQNFDFPDYWGVR